MYDHQRSHYFRDSVNRPNRVEIGIAQPLGQAIRIILKKRAGCPDAIRLQRRGGMEIGKGRFAQRLATVISGMKSKACPDYIKKAIAYVAERIA